MSYIIAECLKRVDVLRLNRIYRTGFRVYCEFPPISGWVAAGRLRLRDHQARSVAAAPLHPVQQEDDGGACDGQEQRPRPSFWCAPGACAGQHVDALTFPGLGLVRPDTPQRSKQDAAQNGECGVAVTPEKPTQYLGECEQTEADPGHQGQQGEDVEIADGCESIFVLAKHHQQERARHARQQERTDGEGATDENEQGGVRSLRRGEPEKQEGTCGTDDKGHEQSTFEAIDPGGYGDHRSRYQAKEEGKDEDRVVGKQGAQQVRQGENGGEDRSEEHTSE